MCPLWHTITICPASALGTKQTYIKNKSSSKYLGFLILIDASAIETSRDHNYISRQLKLQLITPPALTARPTFIRTRPHCDKSRSRESHPVHKSAQDAMKILCTRTVLLFLWRAGRGQFRVGRCWFLCERSFLL